MFFRNTWACNRAGNPITIKWWWELFPWEIATDIWHWSLLKGWAWSINSPQCTDIEDQHPQANTIQSTQRSLVFFFISIEIRTQPILVTFALLPAIFIIWKHLSTVRIVCFLIGGCYNVAFCIFSISLKKIVFPLKEGNDTFKTSRYFPFKRPLPLISYFFPFFLI